MWHLPLTIPALELKAAKLRLKILQTALKAGKGHVPPAFSCIDILTALYYGGIMNHRPKEPKWPERDRFILSKGHAALALYVVLGDLGYFDVSELDSFEVGGHILAGHPDIGINGVEMNTGSLGHGLGVGAGLALAAKLDKKPWMTYCLLGDGECDEGSIWEAAMFSSHHELGNLVAIVDRNRLQAIDYTETVTQLEPLVAKWQAFGWRAGTINGNDMKQIMGVLSDIKEGYSSTPQVIIANTIKGKGVGFMEGSQLWHHQLPKGEQVEKALAELQDNIDYLRLRK